MRFLCISLFLLKESIFRTMPGHLCRKRLNTFEIKLSVMTRQCPDRLNLRILGYCVMKQQEHGNRQGTDSRKVFNGNLPLKMPV